MKKALLAIFLMSFFLFSCVDKKAEQEKKETLLLEQKIDSINEEANKIDQDLSSLESEVKEIDSAIEELDSL